MGDEYVIALAGNPNVGKSTVFNALTGLKQHTGNWAGKTVELAMGTHRFMDKDFIIVDLPGTYSLISHSAEEEIARDFICSDSADTVIVVCDATCLERSLILALQVRQITNNMVVCVNLMDEAVKKKIKVDLYELQKNLSVPVVGTSARRNNGLSELLLRAGEQAEQRRNEKLSACSICSECRGCQFQLKVQKDIGKNNKQAVLKEAVLEETKGNEILEKFAESKKAEEVGTIAESEEAQAIYFAELAAEVAKKSVYFEEIKYRERQKRIDCILTGKYTGLPIMLLLLSFIFWLTIAGANYPSKLLSDGLFWIQEKLVDFCIGVNLPKWFYGAIVLGVYRVLAWVIAVMLPPMAIFFPLFTLLEDLGYLPRVAFNLDHHFKKACTCGKQCLTMCMGLGCNAAGVIGCRIIDSPRERLIAILTNSLVPCNGRFPTILLMLTLFFTGGAAAGGSILTAFCLSGVILLGIAMTFLCSRILSKTVLKGVPSSFTLELPPYRKPQIGKVIIRSVFERTLFVLGRAVIIAAPAGLIIWLSANIIIGDVSILTHMTSFFDPFAKIFGLDGTILVAFLLGFPANEIVVPIMVMAYLSEGTLMELGTPALHQLLLANGWTIKTGICFLLFCLMHWPCSTTCLTIKKETGSLGWTLLAVLIPTICGLSLCFLVNLLFSF